MEVKIGVQYAARELVVDSAQSPAEVEELVEPGELEPDEIHTPGIFVQRIFQGAARTLFDILEEKRKTNKDTDQQCQSNIKLNP